MRFEPGPRGRGYVNQEVMRVVVMGGYIVPDLSYSTDKVGQPSVHVFSLIVNTWERNGETFTASTGIWTKGRVICLQFLLFFLW